ncbi:Rv0361 family membrane protein [Rhodococcus marinonascens]|uniref:Rv0361 family membrane protein n=1 Tax=Rhodococcus marinonascens TaxID=38311 RepID=UPI000932773E|nr:hypothetical protein [Rhodococcus marinonascens]
MSDTSESPEHAGDGDPVDSQHTTATPFIAAAAIIVVVLVGIIVSSWLSPADQNVTEADRINRSVADFIQTHNHGDADLQATLVCTSWSDERSVLAGREGEITLQQVESSEVNGDRARAVVRISADDAEGETTDTWQLTRADGNWLICD